jgi:hypothetical protein
MKRSYIIIAIVFVLLLVPTVYVSAQAFNKGSLLVSLSEGATYARYSTSNTGSDVMRNEHVSGDRDPITVEYGLTKHWGVGINLGGDILHVNPSNFYGYDGAGHNAQVITSEATVDAHYHFFVTKHTDLSAVLSFGLASVGIEGNTGDGHYQYNAVGGIIRGGVEGRYYITKRFGFLGMLTAYSSQCSTKDVKDNTFGNNISTSIKGYTWELGLCFRFLK